jgi:hypothetical protein
MNSSVVGVHKLSELLARRVSRTVAIILQNAPAELSSEGPMASVASFLDAAISGGLQGTATADSVVRQLFGTAQRRGAFEQLIGKRLPGRPEAAAVSPGLWQAFEEAKALRDLTGGQDDYLGLRHVLFVIFTSRDGPLAEETTQVLNVADTDARLAETEIARFCVENKEDEENIEVWRRILEPLKLQDLLRPSSDRPPTGLNLPPRPPRDPHVALLQADDPWASETEDCTGATSEADAFAAMVAAQEFRPPLAVGVFGDWGSGKSFFMRLLYDAIEKIPKRSERTRVAGGVSFYQHVVQIRFNAWHYAETDLWASLVDHIFTSLNRWAEANRSPKAAEKLFDRLTTARRLTVEAAETLIQRRRESTDAAAKLAKANRDLIQRREMAERAPRAHASAALKAIISHQAMKTKLDEAGENLGFGKLSESATDLRAAGAALDGELSRYALFRSGLLRGVASPIVVGLVALSTMAIPTLLVWLAARWENPGAELGAAVSGLVAPLALAFGWAARKTEAALGVVREFRAKLDSQIEADVAQDRANVDSKRAELAAAEAAVREATETLRLANERAAEAARDYNGDSGRGRVLRFVRDRVADGDYAKHLSFVATIRKDFEELSRLMTADPDQAEEAEAVRAAHQARIEQLIEQNKDLLDEAEQRKMRETFAVEDVAPAVFERIVLYIDDLDRCPPDQVVTVLQAIHLLLTFPLFVVFVAVDVRWLRESLIKRYPGQLGHYDADARATASDYLEKIFQIPYWVRPMGLENTRAILHDRMGPEEPENVSVGAAVAITPGTPSGKTPTTARKPSTKATEKALDEPPRAVSLRLTPNERRFINDMAAILDGLPRRTLRFINTYRIIKGSLGGRELDLLEQRGFKALIALLAIGIVAEDDFPRIVGVLRTQAGSDKPLNAEGVLATLNVEHSVARDRVRRGLGIAGDVSSADFADYCTLAARFSFHEGLRFALAAGVPPVSAGDPNCGV